MTNLDEWLSMLRCPETGAELQRVDDETLEAINRAIEAGEIRGIDGEPIDRTLEAALRPIGAEFVYPVRVGIPNFLADDRIDLAQLDAAD